MVKYLLWRWGPLGPQIAVLNARNLDEHDRQRKLAEPVQLKPEEEEHPLDELTKLYPPPATQEA